MRTSIIVLGVLVAVISLLYPMLKSGELFEIFYPFSIPIMRKIQMPRLSNDTYLDFTGAGVYSDAAIEDFRKQVFEKVDPDSVAEEVLNFFGTDSKHYDLIWLASATAGLKMVGDAFPFKEGAKYIYSRSNHNSVIGIRRYAIANNASFHVCDSHKDFSEKCSHYIDGNPVLFALPLEDNFAGTKVPSDEMTRISHLPHSDWTKPDASVAVLADVAAYVPTNRLNLTKYPFHACDLSFYKIFGFPNIGALLLRKDFSNALQRTSFTSESVSASYPTTDKYIMKPGALKFVDDPVPIEMIAAVHTGLKHMNRIGIDKINSHVWKMTSLLYNKLRVLEHDGGAKLLRIYGNHSLGPDHQGGIVTFNVQRFNGQYVGYSTVVKDASRDNFHLRGGCHCNPGSCFTSMGIDELTVKDYYSKKTKCGDENDIVNGIPLGAVRASVGWTTTVDDVNKFVQWVKDTYAE